MIPIDGRFAQLKSPMATHAVATPDMTSEANAMLLIRKGRARLSENPSGRASINKTHRGRLPSHRARKKVSG